MPRRQVCRDRASGNRSREELLAMPTLIPGELSRWMGDQADLQNAFVDGDDVQILELNSEGDRTVDVDASVGNVRRRVCVAGSAWRGAVCPILLIPLSVP